MKRWSWYVGWLLGWFALWTLVFVPVSKLFPYGGEILGGPIGAGMGGAIQGLILIAAWIVLYYGFRFINKKVRTHDSDATGPRGLSDAVVRGGMSEREAAVVATTRNAAFRTSPAVQADGALTEPTAAPDVGDAMPAPAPDFNRQSTMRATPAGTMRSADNPLVRRAFAQAMKEVDTKTYDTGLWAMALVESNGDEHAARLAYIKVRAKEFAWANAKAAESVQMATRRKETELNELRAVEHREVRMNEPRTEDDRSVGLSNLFLAVRRNRFDEVTRILGMYPESIEAKDSYGRPPLHIAVEECNLPMVKALLDLGADPRVTNSDGANVLDIAKREGTPKIVSELQKWLARDI